MLDLTIGLAPRFGQHEIEYYWQTLAMHDTLKYRINDVANPQWADAKAMISRPEFIQGYVKLNDPENPRLVGEFMLENVKGNGARLHFSLSPTTTLQEKREITHRTLDIALQCFGGEGDTAKITTLYGVTPVANRVACMFVLSSRFKKIGIIPNAEVFRGETCDAMVTYLTREMVLNSLWRN